VRAREETMERERGTCQGPLKQPANLKTRCRRRQTSRDRGDVIGLPGRRASLLPLDKEKKRNVASLGMGSSSPDPFSWKTSGKRKHNRGVHKGNKLRTLCSLSRNGGEEKKQAVVSKTSKLKKFLPTRVRTYRG